MPQVSIISGEKIMSYKINKDTEYIRFQGRICFREDTAVLGYTNSSMTFKLKGKKLSAKFTTSTTEEINAPGLRVYIDGKKDKDIVLRNSEVEVIDIAVFPEEGLHEIRLVKITEAGMSWAAVSELTAEGELLPVEEDKRGKILFIGDSITCGYGVLGAPDAEYTVRDEDGELCYAALVAHKLDINAEWVSVSGYGMYVEYTGDPEGILPRVFNYQNAFYDKEERADLSRFIPDNIIVNLGTNDSGPMTDNILIQKGYLARYESFLYSLRIAYPDANIICVLGTLAPGYYKYVQQVLDKVKADGFTKIYGLELPEHDVEHDGMASGHPSRITHEKDADRIVAFMKENKLV